MTPPLTAAERTPEKNTPDLQECGHCHADLRTYNPALLDELDRLRTDKGNLEGQVSYAIDGELELKARLSQVVEAARAIVRKAGDPETRATLSLTRIIKELAATLEALDGEPSEKEET